MKDAGCEKNLSPDNAGCFLLEVYFSCHTQSVLNFTSSGTRDCLKLVSLENKKLIANHLGCLVE